MELTLKSTPEKYKKNGGETLPPLIGIITEINLFGRRNL